MIRCIAALAVVVCVAASAAAAPRTVMVLPLDGSADAETRTKLSASVQKMARVLDGDVIAGKASMVDTATALGCDPAKPACHEQVRVALDVSELVYGSADRDGEQITVVVKRYRKGKGPRELTVTHVATDPPNRLETAVLPVFGEDPLDSNATDPNAGNPTDPNAGNPIDPNATQTPETPTDPSKRERNILIGVTAGGGVILLLGFALWVQAGDLQDDIDAQPVNSAADVERLKELEDKASSRGWAGNVFVALGLGVAGYGGYRLWKHYNKKEITVTPAPTDGGATVTIGGRW